MPVIGGLKKSSADAAARRVSVNKPQEQLNVSSSVKNVNEGQGTQSPKGEQSSKLPRQSTVQNHAYVTEKRQIQPIDELQNKRTNPDPLKSRSATPLNTESPKSPMKLTLSEGVDAKIKLSPDVGEKSEKQGFIKQGSTKMGEKMNDMTTSSSTLKGTAVKTVRNATDGPSSQQPAQEDAASTTASTDQRPGRSVVDVGKLANDDEEERPSNGHTSDKGATQAASQEQTDKEKAQSAKESKNSSAASSSAGEGTMMTEPVSVRVDRLINDQNEEWVDRKMPIPGLGLSVDELVEENRKLRLEVEKIKKEVEARSVGSDVGQLDDDEDDLDDEEIERRRQQLCMEIGKLQMENQQLRSRQRLHDAPYSARSHCTTTSCPQSPGIHQDTASHTKNGKFSSSWSSWSGRSPRFQDESSKIPIDVMCRKDRCSPNLSSWSSTPNGSARTRNGRVCPVLDPVPSGVELYQREMRELSRQGSNRAQRRCDMETIAADLGCSLESLRLLHSQLSHPSFHTTCSPSAAALSSFGCPATTRGDNAPQKNYLKAFMDYLR